MLLASMKPQISSISKCASSRSFIDMSELLSSCLSRSFMFWTTFRVYTRFPWHAFLRDLKNLLNRNHTLGFPRHAEQGTILILYFFLPRSSLESLLYFTGFEGYSINFVPQIRFQVNRDNMLLLSLLAMRSSRHLRLISCGTKRMTVGEVAAGKCSVVHDVLKDATSWATHHT